MLKNLKRFKVMLLGLLGLVLFNLPAYAITNIVSYADGEVTFSPGGLVTPIISGVVAAVGAAIALVLIAVGVRWIYKMIKGAK